MKLLVPDVRSPSFALEAKKQSRLVSKSPEREQDQTFVDSISEMKLK